MRGSLILIATSFFFAALKHIPIADAISIFFIEPFILTLLGGLFLGEPVGWRRIIACMAGFGGALLIIQPQYETVGLAAAFPVGTAICFAFYLLLTRRMTQTAHPITIQIFTACAAFIVIAPILFIMRNSTLPELHLIIIDGYQLFLLIGVGIAATIAHMFLTFAFRNAAETRAATGASVKPERLQKRSGYNFLFGGLGVSNCNFSIISTIARRVSKANCRSSQVVEF